MKLKWWALALTVFGIALSWLGSIPGMTDLTEIYLGMFLIFISAIIWLVVLVRWLSSN